MGEMVDMIDKKLASLYILEIFAALLSIIVSVRIIANPDFVQYGDIARYYANQSVSYTDNSDN